MNEASYHFFLTFHQYKLCSDTFHFSKLILILMDLLKKLSVPFLSKNEPKKWASHTKLQSRKQLKIESQLAVTVNRLVSATIVAYISGCSERDGMTRTAWASVRTARWTLGTSYPGAVGRAKVRSGRDRPSNEETPVVHFKGLCLSSSLFLFLTNSRVLYMCTCILSADIPTVRLPLPREIRILLRPHLRRGVSITNA